MYDQTLYCCDEKASSKCPYLCHQARNGLILITLSRIGLDCFEMLQFVNQSLQAVGGAAGNIRPAEHDIKIGVGCHDIATSKVSGLEGQGVILGQGERMGGGGRGVIASASSLTEASSFADRKREVSSRRVCFCSLECCV